VHFQTAPIRQPDDTAHTPAAARALFHLEMLERGFYVARRGFLALSLPVTEREYDAFCDAFEDFLDTCGSALAS
jgi:glutamate-1-semialdehyde 2,1-aminomutase